MNDNTGSESAEDIYFLCLAGERFGILSRERTEACLRHLRALPPGTETAAALTASGKLAPGELAEIARRAAGRFHAAGGASAARDNERTPEPTISGRIGEKFELYDTLGHGAMSTVYRARDARLKRIVALKVLDGALAADTQRLERFAQEAQAAARVDHPGIVRVHEIGECEGRHYIAMELVDGESLGDILSRGPLGPRRAAEVARDVARALHAAHECGVLHRDVTPHNIILERGPGAAGAAGRARLLDFGLARLDDGGTRLTRAGELMGTPAYLSPEQASGKDVDASADVYSLGAALYHMLSGRPPHEETTTAATLVKIALREPRPLRELLPGLNHDMAAVCAKAMAWRPEHRYASAAEFADDLDRYLRGEAVSARERIRLPRWAAPGAATVLVLVVVAAFVINSSIAASRAEAGRLRTATRLFQRGDFVSALGEGLQLAADGRTATIRAGARDLCAEAFVRLGVSDIPERLLTGWTPEAAIDLSVTLRSRHLLRPLISCVRSRELKSPGTPAWFRDMLELSSLEIATGEWLAGTTRLELLLGRQPHDDDTRQACERWRGLANVIGPPGDEVAIGNDFVCEAVGDLDNDGGSELAIVSEKTIVLWRLDGASPAVLLRHEIAGEAAPGFGPMAAAIGSIRGGAPVLLVYGVEDAATSTGALLGYTLTRQMPAPALAACGPAETALSGSVETRSNALAIGDVTGDGSPDIVIALASPKCGRRTVVIEHPFQGLPPIGRVHTLPQPAAETTDNTSAFVFAAAGRPALAGCTTAGWHGYDFRLYGATGAPDTPFELLSRNQVGAVGAGAAMDMDGDGTSEIIIARESRCSYNSDVFRTAPHTGPLACGIHVFRMARGEKAAVEPEPCYSDPFKNVLPDPEENLRCECIVTGTIGGRPAFLVSWSYEQTRRHQCFADIYLPAGDSPSVERPRTGALDLQRCRVFWSDRDTRVKARFFAIRGSDHTRILTIAERWESSDRNTSPLWRIAVPGDAAPTLWPPSAAAAQVEAAVLEHRYIDAAETARRYLAEPRYAGDRRLTMLRLRALGRAGRWHDAKPVFESLAARNEPSLSFEVGMWGNAITDGLAVRGSRLIEERFRTDWRNAWERSDSYAADDSGGGIRVRIERGDPNERARNSPRVCLVRRVGIDASRGLLLCARVQIREIGWDRHLQIMLVPAHLSLKEPSSRDMYGIDLNHSGGTGRTVRVATLLWGTARAHLPRDLLEEGGTYDLEFEHSPSEGNVRLRVTSRNAGKAWERHVAWPGLEENSFGNALPLPTGEYWFGIFCERQAWGSAAEREGVDVRIESLSLHALRG